MEIKKCTNSKCTHTGNEDTCTICGHQMKKAFIGFDTRSNEPTTSTDTSHEYNKA